MIASDERGVLSGREGHRREVGWKQPAKLASRAGTIAPDPSDAAVPYGLDEQVRGS